ncbi:MAG: zinc-finger domain-containing protein [Pseudomonadota bacterium]
MAEHTAPHFFNDLGAEKISIGVKKFMCMGAKPPFDHPHVFLDIGDDQQIVCPYCSTLYVYDATKEPEETDPPHCIYKVPETV